MTTRRNFLIIAGAGTAVAITGCDVHATSDDLGKPSGPQDTLLLDTTAGLTVIRGNRIERHGTAVVAPDGLTIHATRTAGAHTDLRTIATESGKITATTRLPGIWTPGVVNVSGTTVALVAPGGAPPDDPSAPRGRGRTTMLKVSAGTEPMRLDLAGNYAPDAFTTDDSGIFVLDWLPATAPDHYRVREIDFTTMSPTALYTRDKKVIPPGSEENMRGKRRNAVFGAGNSVLYSLYTNQPGASSKAGGGGWPGDDTAFVHTLNLEQHWAYCVDLPEPFGLGPNAGHAIAIGPDGGELYVVDVGGGRLAVIDTDSLVVQKTVKLPAGAGSGSAYAAATADTLFVGAGRQLRAIDRTTLRVRASWSLPGDIVGLARSKDGARLYVAMPTAVQWYDTRSGTRLGEAGVPALTGIRAVV